MAKGDGKADIRNLVSAHRRSYRHENSGQKSYLDRILFEALPLSVGVVSFILAFHFSVPTSVGLLTTAGLLSAFLFGLMIQISDRAESWSDTNPEPGVETTWHARYLEELSANAGYASIVSMITAILFVLCSATSTWPLKFLSALAIAAAIHLALTMLMVIKRVFALVQERTRIARTGSGAHRGL
jgi:hypothetical protein